MKRSFKTLLLAGFMAMTMSMAVWAGDWQKGPDGWRYQEDDGSFYQDGWKWVGGKCYYFNARGICLTNTTTPDGHQVDKDGAWVVDGVVQTRQTEGVAGSGQSQAAGSGQSQAAGTAGAGQTQAAGAGVETLVVGTQDAGVPFAVSGLGFVTPYGFGKEASSAGDRLCFYNAERNGAILVRSEAITGAAQDPAYLEANSEPLLDGAMSQVGTPVAKTAKQFPSGTWYCYQYDKAQQLGLSGGSYVYARIKDARLQMITFSGDMSGGDPDQIMTDSVR